MPRSSPIKALSGIRAGARCCSIAIGISATCTVWPAPLPVLAQGLTDAEACEAYSNEYTDNTGRKAYLGRPARCDDEGYNYIMKPSSHCSMALRIATEQFRAANCGESSPEREARQKAEQAAADAQASAAAQAAADQAKSNALTPERSAQAQKLFQQSFAMLRSGDFHGAQRGFESGLAIDPGNKTANFYLAETLLREGDATRARTFYNKVIALDPNSDEATKASTALKTLPEFQ
jgi:tetratricopeptide (TPR) repeat protein